MINIMINIIISIIININIIVIRTDRATAALSTSDNDDSPLGRLGERLNDVLPFLDMFLHDKYIDIRNVKSH